MLVKMEPVRYRRKVEGTFDAAPAERLLLAAKNDWASLPKWVRDAYDNGNIIFAADCIHIRHRQTVYPREWLVVDDFGELFGLNSNRFAAHYKAINEARPVAVGRDDEP